MPKLLDVLYVVLLAVVLPLFDYLVSWPKFRLKLQADPARARRQLWPEHMPWQWALVGVGALLWLFYDRSWSSFGFSVPAGWRLWVSIVLILLLVAYNGYSAATVVRSSEARASVRKQFFGEIAAVMPHTRTEMYWFAGVSLTAGFCEEFLFRGYFIWVFTPWLGWWGAAALSVLIFATGHVYQGRHGVLRTGVVGVLFTLVVATLDSLWPAIVLHFLLDLGMGLIAWLALREGPSNQVTERNVTNGVSSEGKKWCLVFSFWSLIEFSCAL